MKNSNFIEDKILDYVVFNILDLAFQYNNACVIFNIYQLFFSKSKVNRITPQKA